MADAIRVLLVGIEPLVAEALAAALARAPGVVVGGAEPAHPRASEALRQLTPDVALLGGAPAESCAERVAELRAAAPDLKVLVLGRLFAPEVAIACLRAGAVGCVTLDRSLDELIDAINLAARGETLLSAKELRQLLAVAGRQRAEQQLRPREREVLQALAAGLGVEEVADQLCITAYTVRTHIRNAMTRLHARSTLQAVVCALRAGLIPFPPLPDDASAGGPRLPARRRRAVLLLPGGASPEGSGGAGPAPGLPSAAGEARRRG